MFCFLMQRGPPRSTRTDTLFPYTPLFRSERAQVQLRDRHAVDEDLPAGGVVEAGGELHEGRLARPRGADRSEEHTSELQSLMRISYAVFCLKKKQAGIQLDNLTYHRVCHKHPVHTSIHRSPFPLINS